MSLLKRIPELVCSACKGELTEMSAAVRCSSCDLDFEIEAGIPNMLETAEMKAFADEIEVQDSVASEYVEMRYKEPYSRRYHQWWTDQMLARVRTEGRILDNGCGIGSLFDRVPSDRVVGLDISREMLRAASEHSDQLILGNSQQLPLRSRSFDIAICRSLLHHLPQPKLAIEELHRVLRPKGEAVFIDTNRSLLSFVPRLLSKDGEHFSDSHQNLGRRALSNILEPYFEIDDVLFFGYIAYPLLGFPDMLNVFRYLPFKRVLEPMLMWTDGLLSRIPGIRTQSWGILVKATSCDNVG